MKRCPVCKGKQSDIKIAIGLGYKRVEPAYVQERCGNCGGSGWVDDPEPEMHHPDIPDSYIAEWWKKFKKKT